MFPEIFLLTDLSFWLITFIILAFEALIIIKLKKTGLGIVCVSTSIINWLYGYVVLYLYFLDTPEVPFMSPLNYILGAQLGAVLALLAIICSVVLFFKKSFKFIWALYIILINILYIIVFWGAITAQTIM